MAEARAKPVEPQVGSRWVKRWRGPRGRKQETRTVIDRTMGGGVVYYVGTRPKDLWREYNQKVDTFTQWMDWVDGATQVTNG